MKVGVVGVGHLGSLHAKMLAEIDGSVLAGVFDLDGDRARRVAGEWGTRSCRNLEELLESVDVLTIATDTKSHFEIGEVALRAGKHLFVEKPVTATVDEAERLIDLARKQNLIIQVGHIERFNPAILALESFDVRPMFVESHRLAQFNPRGTDVAVVLDLMIHDIDIILSFVKAPVARIEANGVAVVSDNVDIANARIQFENGCVANVTGSRISQKRMRKMRLFQRNEYISVDFLKSSVEVFRLLGEGDPDVSGTVMLGDLGSGASRKRIVYEQPEVRDVNPLRYELKLFLEAVRTSTTPIVTAEDGKRALEVAQIIMERIGQQQIPG